MRWPAITLILFLGNFAQAHPVAYKEGFGLMSYNKGDMNELLMNYSLSHRFAVAGTYLKTANSQFLIPRVNFLLKRWNEENSQANIYLSAGSGFEKFQNKNDSAQLAELVVDWESRKYYTLFEHSYIQRKNQSNPLIPTSSYNRSKLRLGFAPFLADYTDLNIWFITQLDRTNDEEQIEATPLLRFYIKNVLWEIGSGFNGKTTFNFMIHL